MSTLSGGPNIVLDGLVLNLDAGNVKSYVSGSTTWNDISRSGNNGTLINGPTFNTGSGGSIIFDGVNDFVSVNSGSSAINPPTAVTVTSFFNISSYGANFAPLVFKQNNYSGFYEQYAIYLLNTGVGITITGVDRAQKTAFSSVDYRNQNVYAVGTCDTITDELKLYINGTLIQTVSFTSTFDIADTPINIGGTGILKFSAGFNGWANGRIYQASIYNRALSAQEVLQNFNATRGRFGI